MDAAADRWAKYLRRDPAFDASMEASSMWKGLKMVSGDYTEAVPGRTFVVTVPAYGAYFWDGIYSEIKTAFVEGETYTFNLSHPSCEGHPMRFSTTYEGTNNGGVEYTTGVTVSGVPGKAGAYVRIKVAVGAPETLYVYCSTPGAVGSGFDVLPSSYIAVCYVGQFISRGGVEFYSLSFGLKLNKKYESVYSAKSWTELLTHELGHALGVGIFWGPYYQGDGAVPPSNNFLSGAAYPKCLGAYRSITSDARYTKIPLESAGLRFTVDTHWEDNSRPSTAAGSDGLSYLGMVNEVMVGQYSPSIKYVISDVSLKALVDMGYQEKNPGTNEGVPTLAGRLGALEDQDMVKLNCSHGRRKPTRVSMDEISQGNTVISPDRP
jgi:hypothetical protein